MVNHAEGAWVDLGTPHVDLTSGMGAIILGHRNRAVDEAVRRQLLRGIAFPLPSDLDTQVAERLISMLTWERAESVRFGKNGADVTGAAVRLARAVTGRDHIAYCDYHGHHAWSMVLPPKNGGVTRSEIALSHPKPRDIDVLEADLSTGVYAAIVIEGSSSVSVGETDASFFARLRRACDDSGTLLVLDEMVTGFRCAPGGIAEVLQIEPDLACYGKAMANGLPLSAIVGPWEYMRRYEEDVFFSLTHGGEALSLAAANETLRIVAEDDVPERIGELGLAVIALFDGYGQSDRLKYGYPQRLAFDFTKAELGVMLEHRVLTAGYANLTLAHAEGTEARRLIMDAFAAVLSG